MTGAVARCTLRNACDELDTLRQRIAELEEAARWIPTREKLPAKYDWYMTRVRFFRVVRSLYFDGRDWIDENEEAVKNVTHWKELPQEEK